MTFIDQTVGNSRIVRYALRDPRIRQSQDILNPIRSFMASEAQQRGPTCSGLPVAFGALAVAGAVVYRAWREDYQSADDIARHINVGARRIKVRVKMRVKDELRLHQALFARRDVNTRWRANPNLY